MELPKLPNVIIREKKSYSPAETIQITFFIKNIMDTLKILHNEMQRSKDLAIQGGKKKEKIWRQNWDKSVAKQYNEQIDLLKSLYERSIPKNIRLLVKENLFDKEKLKLV